MKKERGKDGWGKKCWLDPGGWGLGGGVWPGATLEPAGTQIQVKNLIQNLEVKPPQKTTLKKVICWHFRPPSSKISAKLISEDPGVRSLVVSWPRAAGWKKSADGWTLRGGVWGNTWGFLGQLPDRKWKKRKVKSGKCRHNLCVCLGLAQFDSWVSLPLGLRAMHFIPGKNKTWTSNKIWIIPPNLPSKPDQNRRFWHI